MRVEIDGDYSGIKFSASHFIPGHAKCGRLHGHSYILRLAVHGDIGEDGMIMDFVLLKKALRSLVEALDHRVLLPLLSNKVRVTARGDEVEAVSCGKRYVLPAEDVVLLDLTQTSAEELAVWMLGEIMTKLDVPSNVRRIELGLDEERGQTAWAGRDLA